MIKVYVAPVDLSKEETAYRKRLVTVSDYRLMRLAACKQKEDRLRSLAAELLLRHALCETGIRNYGISQADNGKPYLCDIPLYFSLSHSGERVMCVLSDGKVGCDVQQIRPISPTLAQRFFHPDEISLLTAQPTEKAKESLFFRLWTKKESFVKFTGEGLCRPLSSFSVTDVTCCFAEYDLSDGYEYAVCADRPNFPTPAFITLL